MEWKQLSSFSQSIFQEGWLVCKLKLIKDILMQGENEPTNTYMEYKFIEDRVNMWWVYAAHNGKEELRISQTLKLQYLNLIIKFVQKN
jgi:hypothetical protein